MAKRQYQYTVPRRRRRKYNVRPDQFVPEFWFDGPHLYATCPYLKKDRQFSDKQELDWMVQLAEALNEKYDVKASGLTIAFEPDEKRYRIGFKDDEELVMTKLIHG